MMCRVGNDLCTAATAAVVIDRMELDEQDTISQLPSPGTRRQHVAMRSLATVDVATCSISNVLKTATPSASCPAQVHSGGDVAMRPLATVSVATCSICTVLKTATSSASCPVQVHGGRV